MFILVVHVEGVKFDPQAGSASHIELARSNSRRKRKPGSGPYVVIDNRIKASANTQETSSDDGKLIQFLPTSALFSFQLQSCSRVVMQCSLRPRAV
ncbi:hypothetical protein CXB51_003081 [Gossypium anomalum]|uniref:Uncharacterized protein n=1 Tax=Gossypium anomalum TaxID=47600 RepID=A0A8J5ZZY3_9ROSI|nr:hypothetical protein CXB51_003081 [Gossypium anomalum]